MHSVGVALRYAESSDELRLKIPGLGIQGKRSAQQCHVLVQYSRPPCMIFSACVQRCC